VRPVRLELKGFTAYREPQVLDLRDLDLFAITGPTGSGKSSLLDAMTFALYGSVPRVGNRTGQLISQGQPRMSVMLEFEVDGRRYRVTRTTGRKASQSTIRLERAVDDDWESYGEGADRIREANDLIKKLVGLDYPAFTRSVVLPQGEFAEFMKGDAQKRREILTELLGLELFERMAGRANDAYRSAKDRAAAKAEAAGQYDVDAQDVKAARKAAKEAAARG